MSYDQLKPEIWSHICSFLAPKLPKAMSGVTKREYAYLVEEDKEALSLLPDSGTSRRDIRAGDLSACMRACIDMNNHVAFHLYRTVICDDIPALLSGYNSPPAHPRIASKAQNLARCTSLHVEYGDMVGEPSYHAIMSNTGKHLLLGGTETWPLIGIISPLRKAAQRGMNEVMRFMASVPKGGKDDATPCSFPKLRRLSIGAIFGGHDQLWSGIRNPGSSLGEPSPAPGLFDISMLHTEVILGSNDILGNLFRGSPITHFCQRTYHGPFASADNLGLDNPVPFPKSTLFTMHLPPVPSVVRAAAHRRTRWVLENGPARILATTIEIYRHLTSGLVEFIHRLPDGSVTGRNHRIEIYASSPHSVDQNSVHFAFKRSKPAEEGQLLGTIRQTMDNACKVKGIPTYPNCITSWQPSWQSPPCGACGWCFEEQAVPWGY